SPAHPRLNRPPWCCAPSGFSGQACAGCARNVRHSRRPVVRSSARALRTPWPRLGRSSPNELLEPWPEVVEPVPSARRVVITEGQLLRQERGAILHRLEGGPLVPLVERPDVDDEEASAGVTQRRIELQGQ